MATLRRYEKVLVISVSGTATFTAGTVNAYRRGTTVSGSATVGVGATNVDVPVYDGGNLKPGDVLQKGTASSPTVTVVKLNSRTSVRVNHTSGGAMSLADLDRLVDLTSRPTLYREPTGVSSYGTSVAVGSSGEFSFYAMEEFLDLIVVVSGQADKLVVDQRGGYET